MGISYSACLNQKLRMMRRDTDLIMRIADMDNLRLAFWKAQKSKVGKPDVEIFRKNLEKNLMELQSEIFSGNIRVGDYKYFTIYDPKERRICAASFRERVLHHGLMIVCHDNFERFQIDTSYASRIGKGTYAAIDQVQKYQQRYRWYLKLDVRKYFDSINHEEIKQLLARRFKERALIDIFSAIIDSYNTGEGKGLPIGNLTSQYFANHYLAVADHFVKEQLGAKGYVRYMDDMVIWDNDKGRLLKIGHALRSFLENSLFLKLKPFCLNSNSIGLPFCGYLIFPKMIRLNLSSRRRFKSKCVAYYQKLISNEWSQEVFQAHMLPLVAFAKHANSKNLRRKTIMIFE